MYDTISINPIPQTVVEVVPVSQSTTTSTYTTQMLLTRSSERAPTLNIVNATEGHEPLIKLTETIQEENTSQNVDFTTTSILPVNTALAVAIKFNVIEITFIMTGALASTALIIAVLIYILRRNRARVVYTFILRFPMLHTISILR